MTCKHSVIFLVIRENRWICKHCYEEVKDINDYHDWRIEKRLTNKKKITYN